MAAANSPFSRESTPAYIDPTKASIARVYDAGLGGKDNYAVDREVVDRLRQVAPEIEPLATENRDFLIRVTRFLAGRAGISQFLDCGSGLPTVENTHHVAQRIQPGATVVYVDNDPTVVAHGRALLEENELTHFSVADIFDPPQVLGHPNMHRYLDFSRPIALFQIGTLHHHDGARSPRSIMQEYVEALPSGSYVAVSHFFDPEDEDSELSRKLEHVFTNSPLGTGLFRTRTRIEDMFPGLDMVEPGLVLCADWWPDGPHLAPLVPAQRCIVGGVGRKP